MKKIKPILALAFAAVILLLAFPSTVNAQTGSTYDLIAEVNALTASKGLAVSAIDQAQISYFAQQQQETPVYYNTIITSTPQSDGAIYHIVKEGENLWSIAMAYGTTGAEIMTNTGNSPETTDVYIGQVLTIRRANPATATIAPTPTPTRITPQPTQPAATKTPIPTKTPYPTATPTTEPPLFNRVFADNKTVGLTMVGLSTVGLVLVLIFGFLKKK